MSIDAHVLIPLDVARQIEQTVALCRSVRSHLEHGPHARTRQRLRRQLGRLATRLDEVQLDALAHPLDAEREARVRGALRELDPRLEHVLYHQLDKRELKSLRRDARRLRRELEARSEVVPAA